MEKENRSRGISSGAMRTGPPTHKASRIPSGALERKHARNWTAISIDINVKQQPRPDSPKETDNSGLKAILESFVNS